MKLSYTIICCALLGAFSFPSQTVAGPSDSPAIPSLINYQGYVTDNSNVPLGNGSPTNYDIEFRLYDNAAEPVHFAP